MKAEIVRAFCVSVSVAVLACALWDWNAHAQHSHAPGTALPHAATGAPVASAAGDHSAHLAASTQSAPATAGRISVPSVDLVDQDGRRVRLGRDLLSTRIAVVNFVYTSCTTVCPMQSAVLLELQKALGDRMGRSVELVSISVDPTNDRPEQLKRFATARGAAPGWHWLTGERARVEEALRSFDAYTADYTQHPAMVLVGDPARGDWVRFYGFPSTHALMARLDELAAIRARTASLRPHPSHDAHAMHGANRSHRTHGGVE